MSAADVGQHQIVCGFILSLCQTRRLNLTLASLGTMALFLPAAMGVPNGLS